MAVRTLTRTDIEVQQGGLRMAWEAASARGRAWATAHPDLVDAAPEGVECLRRDADRLIQEALENGLTVRSGDVRVSLC